MISFSPGAEIIHTTESLEINSSIEFAKEFLEKTKIDLLIDSTSYPSFFNFVLAILADSSSLTKIFFVNSPWCSCFKLRGDRSHNFFELKHTNSACC